MPRGAKPGERRGGRQPGSRNKRTQELLDAKAAEGLLPLDYMLSILRDESQEQSARMHAAAQAAPYLHSKLATTTIKGEGEPTMVVHLLPVPKEGT